MERQSLRIPDRCHEAAMSIRDHRMHTVSRLDGPAAHYLDVAHRQLQRIFIRKINRFPWDEEIAVRVRDSFRVDGAAPSIQVLPTIAEVSGPAGRPPRPPGSL